MALCFLHGEPSTCLESEVWAGVLGQPQGMAPGTWGSSAFLWGLLWGLGRCCPSTDTTILRPCETSWASTGGQSPAPHQCQLC